MTLNITDIHPEHVDKVWPSVREILSTALEYNRGEHELPDIHVDLLVGRMKLWVGYDDTGKVHGCVVAELRRERHRTICFILYAAGGDLYEWELGSSVVEEWAYENGADAIQAFSRPGVARRFQNIGYQRVYTVVEKDLTQRRLH